MSYNHRFLTVFFAAILVACCCFDNAHAGDYDGNSTYGEGVDCSFLQIRTHMCGTIGGVSWHIYSTDSWASGPRRYFDDGSQPRTNSGEAIMSGSITASDAKANCANSRYYVAFGFDGRMNGPGTSYVHWGPTQWYTGLGYNYSEYNDSGAIGYDSIVSQINNGTLANGQPITLDAARTLHQQQIGTWSIPNETGYFCAPFPRTSIQGAATAYEIDANTNPDTTTAPKEIAGVDTGWTQTTMSQKVHRINNCPTTGCLARFGLWLKWKEGDSNVDYKYRILRNGIWTDWASATASKPSDSSSTRVKGLYSDTTTIEGKTYRWGIEKLYPGQSVCYELEFLKAGNTGEPVYVGACAVAGGETDKKATLSLKVKKDNGSYQDIVYAKPGEKITYQTVYNPAPQYAYNLIAPQVVEFNCKSGSKPYMFYGGKLGDLMTTECGSWKNSFTIQRKNGSQNWGNAGIVTPAPYGYDVGATSKITKETGFNSGESTITNSDVGKEYVDRAILNVGGAAFTPSEVKTVYSQGNFVENIYLIQLASSSSAVFDVSSGYGSPAPTYQSVHLWTKHSESNQQWIIRKASDGYYTITSVNSGKALDLPYADPASNPQLWVHPHNNSCAQRWKIVDNKDGTYTFLSACNENYAIDAYNGSSEDGTAVWMYEKNGTPAQKWKLVPLNNSYNSKAEIKTDQTASNEVTLRIPYNFKNESTVTTDQKTPLYAGEDKTFAAVINTLPRQNNTTGGSYATKVPVAKHKFEICYNGSCEWFSESGTYSLNASGIMTGSSKNVSGTYTIPDLPAGTDICIRLATWPADSGAETNFNNPNGSDTWYYSPRVCYDVAKKPSLEIWGGNFYTSGNVNTAVAEKKKIIGYNDANPHIFGSWSELGIIASGEVRGLSSGASLGYSGLGLEHKPGGATTKDYCTNSPLSFANDVCNSYVGKINTSNANNPAASVIFKDRDSIINKFSFKDGENNSNVIYDYNAGDFEVGSQEIAKSTIKVYQSDGTITITGNINYENAAYSFTNNSGSKAGDYIPKLLIIAKNINIACNVNRIDGVLLAESTVTTSKCEGSDNINARVNSNPLRINGAVIAGRIIPNRTYGAGPGNNSMVSAETINFDPSLYLWGQLGDKEDDAGDEPEGGSEGENGEKSNLTITSSREIAPRL